MANKFGEYEILQVKSQDGSFQAPCYGWNETGLVYDLRLPDGRTLQIQEDDLETTGKFVTPFRFFEVVEIFPTKRHTEPTAFHLIGKRGVVTGIGAPDAGDLWGYGVSLQNGECWYFQEDELKSIGVIPSEEQIHGPRESWSTVRIRYNTRTGEETVVAGDASSLKRGSVPLRIDLDEV